MTWWSVLNTPHDPQMLSFMRALVNERFGAEADTDFALREAERLYEVFSRQLGDYFEPQLRPADLARLNELLTSKARPEMALALLAASIPDLEAQIDHCLDIFRQSYLAGEELRVGRVWKFHADDAVVEDTASTGPRPVSALWPTPHGYEAARYQRLRQRLRRLKV